MLVIRSFALAALLYLAAFTYAPSVANADWATWGYSSMEACTDAVFDGCMDPHCYGGGDTNLCNSEAALICVNGS